MKTIVYSFVLIIILGNTSLAQRISGEKIPAEVASSFKTKFPTVIKPSWEIEGTNEYEAEFELNGTEVSVKFDSTGKWLETETDLKTSDIPVSVQSSLSKDFTGYKIKEVSKIENINNEIYFEAEIQKGKKTQEILYNTEGKILNEDKIEKETKSK
jgi:hypothetical protein